LGSGVVDTANLFLLGSKPIQIVLKFLNCCFDSRINNETDQEDERAALEIEGFKREGVKGLFFVLA
jgi:hypothetical protein